MSLPYFPLYPTDFEADTSHLTLAEDGAYNRLLRLMWMTPGCTLPDDDAWIMRRMRCDQATFDDVVSVVLAEFFTRKNGRISNARLAREFAKSDLAHKRRVSAGSKGGKAKALAEKEKKLSNAKAMLKQPEPEPEPYIKNRDTNVSLVRRDLFQAKDFADFWDAYPHRNGKKKNRQGAEAAFARAIKAGATIEDIAAGVDAMRRDPDVMRGYARDPTTWLNQRGWTDEIPETPINGSNYGNVTDRSKQSPNGPQNRVDPAVANIARIVGIGPS